MLGIVDIEQASDVPDLAPLGSWWGYAEADPTIVGVLVAAIAVLAVGYVISRIRRSRSSKPPTDPGSRG